MGRRTAAPGTLLIAAVGAFVLQQHVAQLGFVTYYRAYSWARRTGSGRWRLFSVGPTYEEDYPNLARVESLIQDGCQVKDGEAEIACLRMHDKLEKFHTKTSKECSLDNLKCIVLDILERLCTGIDSGDGTIILNRLSGLVSTLRGKFTNWDKAFAHYDQDHSGGIDKKGIMEMLSGPDVGLTESEAALCFFAADADGDGLISSEEFSNFMTAAVLAEDTLDMEADPLPKKMKRTEDFLSWASSGSDSSWGSSLAGIR